MPRATSTVAVPAPPGQHQQTDEHDARDGVEDGQDGQDYSGELGPPGQQDAQHKAQGKADGDGHQGEQKMLADGHRKFIPSQCVSPPQSCSAIAEVMLVLVMMPSTFSSSFRTMR